jgi:hypothetical protein
MRRASQHQKVGDTSVRAGGAVPPGSRIMRLAVATHSLQMKTCGPTTSFSTWAALLPQQEQASDVHMNMTNISKREAETPRFRRRQ